MSKGSYGETRAAMVREETEKGGWAIE